MPSPRFLVDRQGILAGAVLLVLIGCHAPRSGPPAETKNASELEPSTLDRLKRSTVFVLTGTERDGQSGSGFVVGRSAKGLLLVTNRHVVTRFGHVAHQVHVAFAADGQGAPFAEATVLATDNLHDLALLETPVPTGEAREPIQGRADVRETQRVFAVGFPFGDLLSFSQKLPAATITAGTVASIRKDDAEELALIQVDLGINPGNSGGAVVDASGQAIGVAVAKIDNTTIGFAVPWTYVEELQRGHAAELSTTTQGGKTLLQVSVFDPRHQLQRVVLRAGRPEAAESPGPLHRPFAPMGAELATATTDAEGRAVLTAPLTGGGAADPTWIQLGYDDGSVRYEQPLRVADVISQLSEDATSAASADATRAADEKELVPSARIGFAAQVSDIQPLGDGRRLLVRTRHPTTLAIVDLASRSIARTKGLDDDESLVSAGDSLIWTYSPTQDRFHVFGADDLVEKGHPDNPLPTPIAAMAIGRENDGRGILCSKLKQNMQCVASAATFGLDAVKATPPQLNRWGDLQTEDAFRRLSTDGLELRANPQADLFLYTTRISSGVLLRADDRLLATRPQSDRNLVLWNDNSVKPAATNDMVVIPAVGSALVLGLGRDPHTRGALRPSIYAAQGGTPLLTLPIPIAVGDRDLLSLTKRVWLLPRSGLLGVYQPQFNRLALYDYGQHFREQNPEVSYFQSTPPAVVNRGEVLHYQIDIGGKQVQSVRLVQGPEGMRVDIDGSVVWRAPPHGTGQYSVVLAATSESGKEQSQSFALVVP